MKASLTKSISNLPTASAVLQRINAVVANQSSSAQDLVNAVRLDPAIAGKILRLANSAFFGLSRRVASLQNAVVLLGQKRIQSLVLSSAIGSKFYFHPRLPFSIQNYWRHSVAVAQIAESIARYLSRYEAVDAEEVFSAGLLHDVGKLVLCGFEGEYVVAVLRKMAEKSVPFYMAENKENSHGTVGEALAAHWNFPPLLLCGILFHHFPSSCPEPFKRPVGIVHMADAIAHVLGLSIFEKEIAPQISEEAVGSAALEPEQLRVVAHKAVDDQKKIESLIHFFS
jgi:putative nucleotidyltransferase with HDIG domain